MLKCIQSFQSFSCPFFYKKQKSQLRNLMQKTGLKKKSKFAKKPLELRATLAQSLSFNKGSQIPCIVEQNPQKSLQFRSKQRKDKVLLQLYTKVELQDQQNNDSDSSVDLVIEELRKDQNEKEEEIITSNKNSHLEKKNVIFNRLAKSNQNILRKMSLIQQQIQQKIKLHSNDGKNHLLPYISSKNSSPMVLKKQSSSLYFKKKSEKHSSNEKNIFKIQQYKSQKMLNLSNKKLMNIQLITIKNNLATYSSIKILDLSYNTLTNKSIPIINQILSDISIEQLSLKWNQFTYDGMIHFFNQLNNNVSLICLDISYNKLTNNSTRFLEVFIKFLNSNKYINHLNLEMCSLSPEQSQIIAQQYNFRNQTILCIHFKGNSDYHVNKLGYIVKLPLLNIYKEVPKRFKKDIRSQQKRHSTIQSNKFTKLQPISQFLCKYLMGEDCCWMCQKWIKQQFKFEKEVVPYDLTSCQDQDLFIHLSCYDYQPIRMTNTSCVNSIKNKREQRKRIEWFNFEVFVVEVAIPENDEVKYFFTSNSEVILSEKQPKVQLNQSINFQVFDIFKEKLKQRQTNESKFSVYVKSANIRLKDEFYYNKLKKLMGSIYQSKQKQLVVNQNKKALRSIICKRKTSINQSSSHKESRLDLSKISKCMMESADIEKAMQQYKNMSEEDDSFQYIAINTRRIKEKIKSNKDFRSCLSLSLLPRNKNCLFNYFAIDQNNLSIDQQQIVYDDLIKKYFGKFKESYFHQFLKKRINIVKKQRLADKLRIATRKYFNKNETLVSDIIYYLFNFLSKSDKQNVFRSKKGQFSASKQNKFNKSVHFVPSAEQRSRKQHKPSLILDSSQAEEIISHLTATELHEKYIERKAMSMNCLKDKFELAKLINMPVGSVHTFNSNISQTNNTIKQARNMNSQYPATLLFETRKNIQVNLFDQILTHYSDLVSRYARSKAIILELINNDSKIKILELNQIIQTFNYFKLCCHYEREIQNMIEEQLASLKNGLSFEGFVIFDQPNIQIELGRKRSQAQAYQLLFLEQLITDEEKIGRYSLQQSYASFMKYLKSQFHFIKILKKTQGLPIKPSKKRTGKYGRSLKNIKQQLLREQTKLRVPADSNKILDEIQREQLTSKYLCIIRQLNTLSQIFLELVEETVRTFFISYISINDQQTQIVQKWLVNQCTGKISYFLIEVIDQYRSIDRIQAIIQKRAEIFEYFTLNSIIQISKVQILLKGLNSQQPGKEFQFSSLFKNYEQTITKQIQKIVETVRHLKDNTSLIHQTISSVITSLLQKWKQYQINTIIQHRRRREINCARRKNRCLTIQPSLIRPEQKQ